MGRLIFKTLLYATPSLLLFFFLFGLYLYSHEQLTASEAANLQNRNPDVVCSNRYRFNAFEFKKERVRQVRPKALILGSSRAMEFRPVSFKQQPAYNAGGTIQDLSHLIVFSEEMEKSGVQPEWIFLVVDWWWFSPSLDQKLPDQADLIPSRDRARILSYARQEKVRTYLKFLSVSHLMVEDIFKNGDQFISFWRNGTPCGVKKPIGLWSLLQGAGFRADGSYFYGRRTDDCVNEENYTEKTDFRTQMQDQKKAGELRFQNESGSCQFCRRQFLHWLDSQQQAGRHFALLIPPLPESVREVILSSNGPAYLVSTLNWLADVAESRHLLFYDALLRDPLITEEGYLDVSHPTETTNARLLLEFAEKEAPFADFIDRPLLVKVLRSAPSHFDLGLVTPASPEPLTANSVP